MKTKSYILSILFLLGFTNTICGQTWIKDSSSSTSYIDHLFFSSIRGVLVGVDSTTMVLTEHNPDSYWDKENISKSELLVSSFDNSNMKFIKKLDHYVKYPTIKFYNNKYYIFDSELKIKNKKKYYAFYVYNADWDHKKTIELQELPNQKGFKDFVVDKNDNLYFVSYPYFLNNKASDFEGNYLLKISASGETPKKVLFANCIPIELDISNDTLQLTLSKQRIESNFLYTDSVIKIKADTNLNFTVFAADKFLSSENQMEKEITLLNGKKIIFFDSLVKLSPTSGYYISKIVLNNRNGHRIWTKEPNERWIYGKLMPLTNGGFIAKVDKRWDSTSLVVFDERGNERSIKSFLLNADTRIIRHTIIDFFEINPYKILLFYCKEYPTRKEVLYFETIML